MSDKKVLKLVLKSIDEKALVEAVIAELLKPALTEFVKETSNPYDDKLMEYAFPFIEKKIPELVEKLAKEVEEA